MTNGIRLTPSLKAFCPQFSQAEGLATDTRSEPLKLLGTSLAVSSHCLFLKGTPHPPVLILPSLSPQGKNKNTKLVEEHVAFVTFSQMLFYFKKKKKKGTLTARSSWLFRVEMDSSRVDSCTSFQTSGLTSWGAVWRYSIQVSVSHEHLSTTTTASYQWLRWPPEPICWPPPPNPA